MNNKKGRDFTQAEFYNPTSENALIYTWVWNAPVDFETIDNKLEEFQKVGIEAFYILPYPKNFRPNYFIPDTEFEYLSKEFFVLVKYAIVKGKELGMEVWIYDEGGFPSGGASGKTLTENPKAREVVVCERKVTLRQGEKYVPSDDVVATFYNKERIYDRYVADADIDLAEYYTKQADWLAPRHLNSVDSTNKSVIDTFINNTYEAYKKGLGESFSSVSAVFTDEPSVLTTMFPEGLIEKFYKKYGYDIKDYIYCICNKTLAQTRAEQLARVHYGMLLGDLFYENFCKNISVWCLKNDIMFTGHLDIDHLPEGASQHGYFSHLRCLKEFHIPGIDLIWHQIQISENDKPILEEGAPFFPRIASSAAHQNGGNLSVSESFAVYGDGLTPDEFRYILNYQAVRGINVFNVMITTAGDKRMQALVQRPVFTSAKPGYYNMNHINAYYKRLSYLLRLGEPQIDTALYVPCADFWASEDSSRKASKVYIEKGVNLENRSIEFDIIDDYAILSANVCYEGLKIGDMLYKNIVIPDCEFMPDEVFSKIKPFIRYYEPAERSNIRIMKRKLLSGMLYFIFNEGADSTNFVINNMGDNLYRLNAVDGEISKLNSNKIEIVCGDIAIIYQTDSELDTVTDEEEYSVDIKDFKAIKMKRFTITLDGISMEDVLETVEITNAFSGEITYSAEYELPEEPKMSDRYKIVLKDTVTSARVSIDGEQVATMGMTPMEAVVSGVKLNKKGIIEITVANTAANEIVAKKDVFDIHPGTVIGPINWHERSQQFEKNAPAIKFGNAQISKLK